ncbi:AMP-binding protein [Phytoactinopolyspora halotolerans]|uniref:AMP-binding protein n=1 Tax=Phytoactinopolyspora halotolerans TaxID=1981512 RepID=A0A6L9S856_9ACTN|nr:AMP-binding protein [Phytoactinopolyspora halotolerans]NEE01309.1 AMP-binding protein [Phytoactinopolyspora halotolerans]
MTVSTPPLSRAPLGTPAGVPFARGLAVHGERLAVLTSTERLTYADLAERVDACAERLGTARRLVVIAGSNQVDTLVTYLAALAAGHVALLAAPAQADRLIARYDPDVVAGDAGDGWRLDHRHTSPAHDLHPELAVLMSTSGSTGSPKLVRLSARNMQSNAESIAAYLGIRESDRAATTLPMHYCYGLSVVNSHLSRGAGLLLTDLSVVDPCFWDLFREHRGTTFPGVPHTFDLLDRVGFAEMSLPHLRYLTQAGGRLPADRVQHYAALGRRHGWNLFVMYGQTEATARMAYLPPDLAATHPHTIGLPIPGGSFSIEPVPDDDAATGHGADGGKTTANGTAAHDDTTAVGELVYQGPNVMLGYAENSSDLALGRTTHMLHTGDLARRTDAGLYEIVGRRSRFVKIAGLRVDPQQVEALLAERGLTACCAGMDGLLCVAVEAGHDRDAGGRPPRDPETGECTEHGLAMGGRAPGDLGSLRLDIAGSCALPPAAVQVFGVDAIPRLGSGKPDHAAVLDLAVTSTRTSGSTAAPRSPDTPAAGTPGTSVVPSTPSGPAAPVSPAAPASPAAPRSAADPATLRDLYAEILHRPDATEDATFVSLGGDSLSYVEMSIRLEEKLGTLPLNWHTTPIRDLAPRPRPRPFGGRAIETSVVLRAAAIVAIVGTHAGLFTALGGAHALLAVAGFNFARFRLDEPDRRRRLRQQLGAIARIAVPSMVWIAAVTVLTSQYGLTNILLLNGFLGSSTWTGAWHFWFVEVLVYILIGLAVLMAVPWADRLERRFPFSFALAVVAMGLLTRYEVVGLGVPYMLPALWLFALGWAAARARTVGHRLLLTAVTVAAVPGFFDNLARESVMIAGVALLLWTVHVPCPAVVGRIAGVLASASLYIYLVHWQVYPHLTGIHPAVAVAASLLAGLLVWRLAALLEHRLRSGRVWSAARSWTPPRRADRVR